MHALNCIMFPAYYFYAVRKKGGGARLLRFFDNNYFLGPSKTTSDVVVEEVLSYEFSLPLPVSFPKTKVPEERQATPSAKVRKKIV